MSEFKVEPADAKVTLGKRTYLPLILKDACPECGHVVEVDLSDRYLSYPTIGEPFYHAFLCGECDEQWSVTLILKVSLERSL